jgi:hypothetical protein
MQLLQPNWKTVAPKPYCNDVRKSCERCYEARQEVREIREELALTKVKKNYWEQEFLLQK